MRKKWFGLCSAIWGALVSAFLFVPSAQALHPALPCDVYLPTECQITTLHNMEAGGTFSVPKTLHIMSGGHIKTDPSSVLEIEITGDFIMDDGAKVSGTTNAANETAATVLITTTGNVLLKGSGASGAIISMNQNGPSCSGGKGGKVDILSTGGNITVESGAKVTVDAKCPAGEIELKAPKGLVTIDGLLSSESKLTGTGGNQRPGGGPVTIVAGCDLTVGTMGIVRSKGRDPGADLVHLEGGCDVAVLGLVQSTGPGHAVPNNPVNHCNNLNRPDKQSNSTACVEIWSGGTLTINAFDANNGQVNADTAQSGGHQRSWIDMFASGNISIIGDVAGSYAVHANQSVTNADGGIITVKSVGGSVTTSGLAVQANATKAGSRGGEITIHAGGAGAPDGNLDFGSSSIQARGGNAGTFSSGGTIEGVSFTGALLGTVGGQLNAGGGVPANGTVTLQSCVGTAYNGAVTPAVTINPDDCAGAVSLPAYVVLPTCSCGGPPPNGSCPVCELDGGGMPVTVVVDQNTTVDFNPAIPACVGDADLCAFFTYDKTGLTPDTWKGIFDLGGKKLVVMAGVTVKTAQVPPAGSERAAPGIEIRTTCEVVVELSAVILVESYNDKTGDVVIHADGKITIDGEVTNRVTGTLGVPGNITISSYCGDVTTGPMSLIQNIGIDRGGGDIIIASCCGGDVVLNGLVLARAKAHATGAPKPDIYIAAFEGDVVVNANTAEPFFDEYNPFGTKYDIFPGVLSWVTHASNPGSVTMQASGNVEVYGHGDDATPPVRPSFAAIATGTGTSNPRGGKVDVRAGENAIGTDRALESFGNDNLIGGIKLWAGGDVNLARLGANNSFGPVVDSAGSKKGGPNEIRAFQGAITIAPNTLVDASAPVLGVNLLTSCVGVTNSGTVSPPDANAADDAGVCAQTSPAPLFADCKALGVNN